MHLVFNIELKCNQLDIECPLRWATLHYCTLASTDFMMNGNINPKELEELTTLIDDILNDDSNKLALLNLNHRYNWIQFISKYKLNINCKDLTSLGT